MSSSAAQSSVQVVENVEQTRQGRPPGLFVPPINWLGLIIGCLGMPLDSLLALPVLYVILDLPVATSIAIMFGLGAGAAATTIKAGVDKANGKTGSVRVLLGVVIGLGVALAVSRFAVGMIGGGAGQGAFATQMSGNTGEQIVAAVVLLVFYLMSVAAVFFSAANIFVAERTQLGRHDRARTKAAESLARLEPEYVAVHERIAYREKYLEQLSAMRDSALDEVEARKKESKDYARDAIARGIGRPDTTPTIRAPHEPAASESRRPVQDESDDPGGVIVP